MPKSAIFTSPSREHSRFDGLMSHVQRLPAIVDAAVRVLEALERLDRDVQRRVQRQARLGQPLEQTREVHAVDVLHDEHVVLAEHAEVEHLHDARVAQRERRARLLHEQRHAPAVAAREDALDGHLLRDAVGADGLGEEHLAHAAGSHVPEDAVSAGVRGRATWLAFDRHGGGGYHGARPAFRTR
jgi:hypothetical protein